MIVLIQMKIYFNNIFKFLYNTTIARDWWYVTKVILCYKTIVSSLIIGSNIYKGTVNQCPKITD